MIKGSIQEEDITIINIYAPNIGAPQKLKTELPYDPAIPLLGIYPEKTTIQKDTCTPMFIAALFTIARSWKQIGRASCRERV